MAKPVAVLVSDIHYSVPTLEVADASLRLAITKANELNVPLIVAGDLHDTKANMRAECVNRMLETFGLGDKNIFVIIGNHDRVNEKAPAHALNFLSSLEGVFLIEIDDRLVAPDSGDLHLLPYYHDPEELRTVLKGIPKGSTIIMHQGIEGSHSGEYIQDHSAITHDDVKDFRVISGHYHRRQTIKTGRPRAGGVGLFDYIGNPYTLNFGEANDPEKGFQVLMDDGSLEFVPTNLRKHIVYSYEADMDEVLRHAEQDLVWVKAAWPKQYLATITKREVAENLGITQDFRLTLESTDTTSDTPVDETLTDGALLDSLIDTSANLSAESKERLKSIWKQLVR